MTPAAILAEAAADGLTVTVSPSGGLRVRGDPEAVERWQPALLGAKAGLLALLMRRGFGAADADDLAERLHLRDARRDDRRLCIECQHFSGPARCANYRAAGRRTHHLPADLATVMQRCPGFGATGDGDPL